MHTNLAELTASYAAEPYTAIGSNEPYGPGKDDPAALAQRSAARQEFLDQDQLQWPNLAYPLLVEDDLIAAEKAYNGILNGVIAHESQAGEAPESDILYEMAARKLAEVYRHREVLRLLGHTAVGHDELAELSRSRAANMSGELFGEPDEASFRALLADDIRQALAAQSYPGTVKSILAYEYLALLGLTQDEAERIAAEEPASESYELQDSTIEIIRDDWYALFPDLESAMAPFAGRDYDTTPTEAQPAFDAALGAVGLLERGWKTRMLGGRQKADTDGPKRTITYGAKRKNFTPTSIIGTPVHESIHALRYQNGSEQAEPYRRVGLPGSLEFGEGFPVAIEQVLSGVKRVPGLKYDLQIGLLKGMHLPEDIRREQSYRTVDEIMWRRAALQETTPLDAAKVAELQSDTYDSVMRTARGNARDNRDINYFNGGRKAALFLNETAKLPTEIRRARLRWVLSGRFDPTNPKQAALFGGDPAAAYLSR